MSELDSMIDRLPRRAQGARLPKNDSSLFGVPAGSLPTYLLGVSVDMDRTEVVCLPGVHDSRVWIYWPNEEKGTRSDGVLYIVDRCDHLCGQLGRSVTRARVYRTLGEALRNYILINTNHRTVEQWLAQLLTDGIAQGIDLYRKVTGALERELGGPFTVRVYAPSEYSQVPVPIPEGENNANTW